MARSMPERPALALPTVEAVAGMTDAEVRVLALTVAAAAQQVAAVQTAVAARLAVAGPSPAKEPPLTAKEAARRLNVGVDWVRDHGAEKGLEVRLSSGTVRYDPDAIERLRQGIS